MKPPSTGLPDHPSHDLTAHLAHVRKLYEKYPYRIYADGRAALPDIMQQIDEDRFPHQIATELGKAVFTVLRQANVFFLGPPDEEDADHLKRLQVAFTSSDWPKQGIYRAAMLFRELYRRLPQSVFEEQVGTMRVPLYELIENVPDLIMMLTAFAQAKHGSIYIFEYLVETLRENTIRASGYDPSTYEGKPLTWAHEAKMPIAQLIQEYLGGTPFANLLCLEVPFVIPRKTWASHAIILAPPNHGKTMLLGSLFREMLEAPDSPGMFLLDPHGDLFHVAKERVPAERLVVLDPDTNPPPLNFLDFGTSTEAQTLQTFEYLMSALAGGLSDKQRNIVPYLLKLLRKVENPSIQTLAHIVGEKAKSIRQSAYADAIAALDSTDQLFFETVWFSDMSETKQAINWRLLGALASDTFRKMFGARHNSFDADAAIRDRKVVLVKGGVNSLGKFGMEVFLQYIITQYFAAGLRRERLLPHERHLCIMLVDEAHTVLNSKTINDILVELRKYGCSFVAATQTWHQIGDEVKAAVLGATAIRFVGPVSHNDAVVLSREMHTSPDFIRSMKARERESADWACYVQNVTPHAIRVTVPYGILENLPKKQNQPPSIPESYSKLATDASGVAAPFLAPKKKPPSGSEGGLSRQRTPEPDTRKPHNPDDFAEKW
ncbi:MAG: hypothetical protein E6G97_09855 [Alphaproteobacteria bacterium]|nr:MAG: hypothetical protein E6G97_09855 [Alphaproteobacteria bacterium]